MAFEDTQRQLGRLRAFLKRGYSSLIDTADLQGRHEDPERSFLSRAQAALALEIVAGLTPEKAAASVTDDFKDRGMDAIGIDAGTRTPRLVVVQSKWKTGAKSLSERDVLAWKEGLELLLADKYERLNPRIQERRSEISAALHFYGARITLVPVLPSTTGLPGPVKDALQNLCDDFNEDLNDETFLWAPVGLNEMIGHLDLSAEPPRPTLHAHLTGATWHPGPVNAIHGTISATTVSEWFDDKRYDLFLRNVRNPLGMTDVNQEIVATVLEQPERFWYLNHGITVSCDRIVSSPHGSDLELTAASIIDGAQTVASLHHAYRQAPELVDRAMLRAVFVSSEGAGPGFVRSLVRGKNRQNGTEAQDFIADQPEQTQLRKDFSALLGKAYVLRRGEQAASGDEGCGLLEAARALACAHGNPAFAHRAAEPWKLWTEETYPEVFTPQTDVFRIWRAVQALRACAAELATVRKGLRGRAAAVADHGIYLIAHLVLRLHKGWEKHSEDEWRALEEALPGLVEKALRWAVHHVDHSEERSVYIGALFNNERRFVALARRTAASLEAGAGLPQADTGGNRDVEEPQIAPRYLNKPAKKQPFASHVLVDNDAIANGTVLEFTPKSTRERAALSEWLAEDPRRGRATWVNSRSRYLLWEVDGKRYSANSLYKHMFHAAGAADPGPRQVTALWNVPDRGSLAELATRLVRQQEEDTLDTTGE